ncbi:uncharacterized protein LOC127556575 [Antechinus flavipes]|uniref:uncharacterized protein LOC127556575 n=1 Tax=Antechinus flavipes TaxID=38775 RepID=UPI002235584D|nr:uncharacterized protein LOC127556575 [Antechinus flavipes]
MAGLARVSHSGLLGTPVESPGGRRPARSDRRQLSIPLPFPPPKGQPSVRESLPPEATCDSLLLDLDEDFSRWETSSGAAHGPKSHGGMYAQPDHRLSSRIRKTLGIKELGEKLQLRPRRYPLSMAYQKSEMREKYPGWPNLGTETSPGPEFWDRASQALSSSSKDPALSEKPFFEPYLTTTSRDFRYYPKKELSFPPWSFRSQPPSGALQPKRPLPQEPCADQPVARVPHRGALSLMRESYGPFQQSLPRAESSRPGEARPRPSLPSLQALYRTESSRYGSLKPDFV